MRLRSDACDLEPGVFSPNSMPSRLASLFLGPVYRAILVLVNKVSKVIKSFMRFITQCFHYTRLFFFARTPLWGMGVISAISEIERPTAFSPRRAASLPAPGPLIYTSTSRMPVSMALRATASTAVVAAYGVDLRAPLKPAIPEEPQ